MTLQNRKKTNLTGTPRLVRVYRRQDPEQKSSALVHGNGRSTEFLRLMMRKGFSPPFGRGSAGGGASISPRRLRHCQAVAHWASELARLHGADPVRAERAGLLHDLAKEWTSTQLAAYVRRNKIRVPGLNQILAHRRGGLLHGYVSAHVAKRKGFVRDRSTLQAMARHTLGHPRLGLLDKILYVADFSSSDRRYAGADHVRRLARQDLEAALRATVAYKIVEVIGRSSFLHPMTVALWNQVCQS